MGGIAASFYPRRLMRCAFQYVEKRSCSDQTNEATIFTTVDDDQRGGCRKIARKVGHSRSVETRADQTAAVCIKYWIVAKQIDGTAVQL